MKAHGSRRGSRAFTLIELMLAIAILGGIMAAIYSSWYSIMRGTKSGLEAASEVQRARIAVKTVEDALLSVQFFQQNVRHYEFVADSSGDYAYLSFVAKLPASFPRSGRFGDLSVRRLTFNVEAGPDRQNQLVLRQQPYLMETNIDEELYPLVLAKNVNTFLLEFWDQSRSEWVTGTVYTNQLPKMVRFTFGFGSATTTKMMPEDYVTRVVSLPAMAIPVAWQMPQVPGGGRPPGGGGGPPPPPPTQPPPPPRR